MTAPGVDLRQLAPRRRQVVIAALVVVGVAGWTSWHRPAHSLPLAADGSAWSTEVRAILGSDGSRCASSPTAASLAGLGRVSVSCHVSRDHRSADVVFWRVSGLDGLEYASGYPPPLNSCVAHLGGPWWQLAHAQPVSESCPRGFHYTPGG